MKIGTTFSYREANFLGLDWQKTLENTLKLNLNPIRIGSYWNDIEIKPNKYDFSLLDEIIAKIKKDGTEIVLEIGLKSPRWPEFYPPKWLEKKIKIRNREIIDNLYLTQSLFKFIEKTVKRYEKIKNIRWINLENEPLNFSGPKFIRISPKILKKEVLLLKDISQKPLILNSWLELSPWRRIKRNLLLRENSLNNCLKLGDILGLSVYPKYPDQPEIKKKNWQVLKKILKETQKTKKETWITELQAEPWEKEGSKNFKDPFANESCNPDILKNSFDILKEIGFKTILLWGSEFWYRCHQEKNNYWYKTVKEIIKNAD